MKMPKEVETKMTVEDWVNLFPKIKHDPSNKLCICLYCRDDDIACDLYENYNKYIDDLTRNKNHDQLERLKNIYKQYCNTVPLSGVHNGNDILVFITNKEGVIWIESTIVKTQINKPMKPSDKMPALSHSLDELVANLADILKVDMFTIFNISKRNVRDYTIIHELIAEWAKSRAELVRREMTPIHLSKRLSKLSKLFLSKLTSKDKDFTDMNQKYFLYNFLKSCFKNNKQLFLKYDVSSFGIQSDCFNVVSLNDDYCDHCYCISSGLDPSFAITMHDYVNNAAVGIMIHNGYKITVPYTDVSASGHTFKMKYKGALVTPIEAQVKLINKLTEHYALLKEKPYK